MSITEQKKLGKKGFSSVEFLIAAVVFGILTTGLFNAYISMRHSYETARQLSEMYTVLSACPEIDRALEFNSLEDTANCSPNNAFVREDGRAGTRSYTPKLDVTLTTDPSIPSDDPLKNVPDSKIVNVSVGFQNKTTRPMELRMLITRNGVGQQ